MRKPRGGFLYLFTLWTEPTTDSYPGRLALPLQEWVVRLRVLNSLRRHYPDQVVWV